MESVTKINYKRKNLVQHIGTALTYVDYGITCPCGNLCRRTKIKNNNNKKQIKNGMDISSNIVVFGSFALFSKEIALIDNIIYSVIVILNYLYY